MTEVPSWEVFSKDLQCVALVMDSPGRYVVGMAPGLRPDSSGYVSLLSPVLMTLLPDMEQPSITRVYIDPVMGIKKQLLANTKHYLGVSYLSEEWAGKYESWWRALHGDP